jgi:hypothetical protein
LKREKAKVLVLGTFHMSEHEDLYSEKRQTDIEELVSIVANYGPTKIAVEMVAEKNEVLNKKYKQYKFIRKQRKTPSFRYGDISCFLIF